MSILFAVCRVLLAFFGRISLFMLSKQLTHIISAVNNAIESTVTTLQNKVSAKDIASPAAYTGNVN